MVGSEPDAAALLVGDCLRGREEAWARLAARYGDLLRRAARARTRDAEEVVQKVLVRLSTDGGKALRTFGGRCSLETWLSAVVLNEAAHHEQARGRRDRRERAAPPAAGEVPDPLRTLCRIEEGEKLREALGRVPARDRLALTLAYWDGLTHQDIANLLGVAVKTVGPLLLRARGRLKASLEKGS